MHDHRQAGRYTSLPQVSKCRCSRVHLSQLRDSTQNELRALYDAVHTVQRVCVQLQQGVHQPATSVIDEMEENKPPVSVRWARLVVTQPNPAPPQAGNGCVNFKHFRSKAMALPTQQTQRPPVACVMDAETQRKGMEERGHLIRCTIAVVVLGLANQHPQRSAKGWKCGRVTCGSGSVMIAVLHSSGKIRRIRSSTWHERPGSGLACVSC